MPKDGFKQSVDSAVDRVKELKWTPWSKRSGTSGTCKSITKGAREFLEAVSGGDMVEFMKGLLKKDEKAELFMSLCGSLPQCINSLPLDRLLRTRSVGSACLTQQRMLVLTQMMMMMAAKCTL
eukprot:TRINITY_DN1604_c0_g1_i14.p2 TRINITY_DN1604_c0_g1~~TRINITY_DN1604_c0_g1_i14.p2  ORF type:complete len:123 (-),score=8.29 TRINITY_DN1604_c0_g1_i14:785-1153(-)